MIFESATGVCIGFYLSDNVTLLLLLLDGGGCSFRILLKCLRFRGDNNTNIRCRVTRLFLFFFIFIKCIFDPADFPMIIFIPPRFRLSCPGDPVDKCHRDDDDNNTPLRNILRARGRTSVLISYTEVHLVYIFYIGSTYIIVCCMYVFIRRQASFQLRARFMCKSPTS